MTSTLTSVMQVDNRYTYVSDVSGLTSLKSRRESLTTRLFKEILEDPNHNLHGLLPPMNETIRSLRQKRTFSIPRCKTKRYQSSFIIGNPFIVNCKFLLCKSIMEPGVVYTLLIIVDFKECSHHFKLLSFYIFL